MKAINIQFISQGEENVAHEIDKEVITFGDLEFYPHRNIPGGTCARLEFPHNKYGVSVVSGSYTYSGDGTYEVAILYNGSITYNTPLTHDVLAYQDKEDINKILATISHYTDGQWEIEEDDDFCTPEYDEEEPLPEDFYDYEFNEEEAKSTLEEAEREYAEKMDLDHHWDPEDDDSDAEHTTVYLFIETVSSKVHVQGIHQETFNTYAEACGRLKQVYRDTVIEGDLDNIKNAEYSENDACVCYKDDFEIDWDVIEESLLTN